MVHQHLRAAGQHIYKRFADEPEKINFPSWAPAVALADFVLFLPIILLVGYTLAGIIPTLAIVEDPNPPAYEPVALDEGVADQGPSAAGKPITSSLRATRRLLASVAGWRSYFRGIALAAVIGAANSFVGGVLDSAIPFIPVGRLLAQLALTQLRTAWTHIVISAPSELRFYQRLPPFKKTFEATCFPIFVVWVAEAITISGAVLLTKALGLPLNHGGEEGRPNFSAHDAWKGLVVLVVVILLELVTVVPANVLLVRVQASLLGPDESVILPFDRSFGGKLEPAIVGGKGYITLRDAMASFSRPSWIRLYKLYAKIVAVTIAAYGLMMAVIVPEILLIMSKSSRA